MALPDSCPTGGCNDGQNIALRFTVLMAIGSAVFIYGMVQEFSRLPPQSGTTNQSNPQPR